MKFILFYFRVARQKKKGFKATQLTVSYKINKEMYLFNIANSLRWHMMSGSALTEKVIICDFVN